MLKSAKMSRRQRDSWELVKKRRVIKKRWLEKEGAEQITYLFQFIDAKWSVGFHERISFELSFWNFLKLQSQII